MSTSFLPQAEHSSSAAFPCPVVDALRLPADVRSLLRPDEMVQNYMGHWHRLPRFFYEIESWALAKATFLTPHFRLSELLVVDCREAGRLLTEYPHYVPCAVVSLARCLEDLRARAGGLPVFVAANGGYRSPAHRLDCNSFPSRGARFCAHQWAVAADIYRIGDTWLHSPKAIEKYAELARTLGPDVRVAPYGHQAQETDDHLHLDLGHVLVVPATCDERAQIVH